MAETWFRGEAIGGPVSRPGGDPHDLGDGMYLTDRYAVADWYAATRAPGQKQRQQVLAVELDLARLGKVLDLRTDQRWSEYFRVTPMGGRLLELMKTGQLNEIYGRTFNTFLETYKIDRNQYDVIIGPEYVRGGSQMCIVHKNGQPTQLTASVRASFKVVSPGPPLPPVQPKDSIPTLNTQLPPMGGAPKTVFGKVLSNRDAAMLIGQALGGFAQWLGDKVIESKVQRELETTHLPAIRNIMGRGDGVLIILHFQEWKMPDNNGMRARTLLGVSVMGGKTQDDALRQWTSAGRITAGPAEGWRSFERYGWIPPGGGGNNGGG